MSSILETIKESKIIAIIRGISSKAVSYTHLANRGEASFD